LNLFDASSAVSCSFLGTLTKVDADKVVDNSTRPNNGIVTMKGKGDVQTWAAWQNMGL